MGELVVVGGGGHAKVLISVIQKLGAYRIVGFTDRESRPPILGVPCLGTDEKILPKLLQANPGMYAALGVGCVGVSPLREKLVDQLTRLGFRMPAIVSPDAVVNETAEIGDASMVFDGVVVQAGVKIGKGVILNTSSSVDHDCIIGDYVHLAPGVVLSGEVSIGRSSVLGTGAVVIQGCEIGAQIMVGAGGTVVKDCLEAGTYVGTPAKRIK